MTLFEFYCVGVALPAFCYGMYLMYFEPIILAKGRADDYIIIEHKTESEIEMEPIKLARRVQQVACTEKKREELETVR